MNKNLIAAMVLLLAGIALISNYHGISCPLAGESSSCQGNGNCQANGNCTGNCGVNYTCPNDAADAQNNSSEANCSALGSCPVKAPSTKR